MHSAADPRISPTASQEVADCHNPGAASALLLVCEHASNHISREYADLGLDDAALASHIAWDPGARAVADAVAGALDAALVAARVSRLVYDLNRPPESPAAIPEVSGGIAIPGNAGLAPEARAARAARYHGPFHALIAAILDSWQGLGRRPGLITLHSFTPQWEGRPRPVQVGVLHDEADSRLADRLLAVMAARNPHRLDIRRNQPYGPDDGVTHTLRLHAVARGLPNVMIEIRNDLIATAADQQAMAGWLADCLRAGLDTLPEDAHAFGHA